jgi:L-fuculose-phosphate aldolase
MPDRRPSAHACEDDAREALHAARLAAVTVGAPSPGVPSAGAPSPGAACVSLRWPRSGAAGFLVTGGIMQPAGSHAVDWVPLQDGADTPRAADEWRLHRDLYRERADVEAIVRCRPMFATTLACSRDSAQEGLPGFHPDVPIVAGGPLACADCGLPGSALRTEPLLAALQGRWACLLAGWGLLACGASLPAATARAVEVEALAAIWWHVRQLEVRGPR